MSTPSPGDVQAKLAQAEADLAAAEKAANAAVTQVDTEVQAASDEAAQLVAPALAPPAASTFGPWKWDAVSQPLDPNSSALVAAAFGSNGYAINQGVTLSVNIGAADTAADSPGYGISGVPCVDSTVYIPLGSQPGVSTDHHMAVRDAIRGREHDLWKAVYDATTRRITSASGGVSFPIDAIQEPAPGNANAARFPLLRGVVTPGDVASGVIDHPLVFSCKNVGPAPNRYPANSAYGYPSNSGFPLGTWVRLDPAVDVAALNLPKLETMMCVALQKYGMFCRDIAGSNMTIAGLDPNGGGDVDGAWKNAGIALIGSPPWYAKLGAIPWARMQILTPPAA